MGIRDDIRIGKLYAPEPDLPAPSSPVPEGCERVRTSAGTWRVFRKATEFELKYGRDLVYGIHDEPDPDLRRVIDNEGARPTSLIPVHAPPTRDPLHDLQLLRDLKIINERTIKELGPLPNGGLPVQAKRKPEVSRAGVPKPPVSTTEASGGNHVGHEDESVKLRHLAATAALTAGALAGCSDPNHPSRNPHPTQRYEVTITTDAPGAWDEASKAVVFYDVTNWETCTPEAPVFIGGHLDIPLSQDAEIEMTQVAENTWRGYFYRDLFHDEDYHGLGVCHWDATQVAPDFFARGVSFGDGQWVKDALQSPQVRFFRKSVFWGRRESNPAAMSFDESDPEVRQSDEFFFIAVSVKEVKP
ncbi:hypothetical protein [Dyella japonica]|uniref:Uncharacterized protein n=1 Tax=Dyella japonica TaxID=231455 RepID=A0ABV2JVR8_9GAMM